MTRFYVEYIPDVGYMALAVQPAVIQATGWRDAYKNWHKRVGPAFDRYASPVACFALPSFMQDWPDKKVIEHYRKHEFDGTYIAPENNPFRRLISFFKGTETSR